MKKYALTLMILAGSLTTYISYKYSESKIERSNINHNVLSNTPTKLVNQEENLWTKNIDSENEKIVEAKKRIQKKFEELPDNQNELKEKKVSVNSQKNITVQNLNTYSSKKETTFILEYETLEKVEDALKVSVLYQNKLFTKNKNVKYNKIESTITKKNISELQFVNNNVIKEIYADSFVEKQEFLISNQKENYIIGKKGTMLIFPPNIFLNSKGMIENENILIQLQEFNTKSEILLSGFYTQNIHEIFDTEGIISVKAFKNGEELTVNPSKKFLICLKTDNEDNNYYLFNQNLNNEWQQIAEQDKNLIPLPLEILNLHNVFGNTYDKSIIATKAFAKRYEYYSNHAQTYKKAITGIYLSSIKEPLYKADENVLLYLRDVKADKQIIQQFEKFYQEKLGQVVNFANVFYTPENSLSDQFEQNGNSRLEAERMAQYFLVRKGYQEWFRNNPTDKFFANKIYKVSKLGTFSSMKFQKNLDTFTSVHCNTLDGINLEKCSIYFINDKTKSISKLAVDKENKLYIPHNFQKGNIMILDRVENQNYMAMLEVTESNTEININQNIDFQKFTTIELENKLTNLFH